MQAVEASRKLSKWENIYLTGSLLVIAGGLGPLNDLTGFKMSELTDVNPARLLITLVIYLTAGALLLRKPAEAGQLLRDNLLVVALFTVPMVSVLWSVDPGLTFRRASSYLLTGVFCFYLRATLTQEDLIRRVVTLFFYGAIASYAYAIFLPAYGITHNEVLEGTWKGIYGQKNDLGRICSIAIMLSFFCAARNKKEKRIRAATIIMSLGLCYLSQSRTNWLIVIAASGLIPMLLLWRTQRLTLPLRAFIVVFIGVACLCAVTIGGADLLTAMGRTHTYSGRETMWRGVIDVVNTYYFGWGSGYGAFFTEAGAVPKLRPYLETWGDFMPGHAHNGYLNTWAELGIPGVTVLAIFMVALLFTLMKRMMDEPWRSSWVAFLLIFFLFAVNNFSETVAYKRDDIAWALIALSYLYSHVPIRVAAPSFRNLRFHRGMAAAVPRGTAQ